MFRQVSERQRIVGAINKTVFRSLVPQDTELAVHVILQLVIVPVEVIGRNIHQHADIGPEIVTAVQLETAQLDHVPIVIAGGHRQRETFADISGQADVHAGLPQNLVGQRRRRRLAVAAGDADRSRRGISPRKLDFRNNRDSPLPDGLHHRSLVRNPRAFHDFVGRQDFTGRMPSLLIRNIPFLQQFPVLRSDTPPIRQKHVESFYARQHRRPATALASSQYHDPLHRYLILSVTNVMAASSNCTIQKRTTIFDSK